MRLLTVSDMHGDLGAVREAVARFRPDALLSCGDWGDPDEVDESALAEIVGRMPAATTFGNHDPRARLEKLRDARGAPFLLAQGEVRGLSGTRIADRWRTSPCASRNGAPCAS